MKISFPAIYIVLFLLIVSCGPSGESMDFTQPIELEVWTVEEDLYIQKVLNPTIERFKEIHPYIDIKLIKKDFHDLRVDLRSSITLENPPDITQVNQGFGDMKTYVDAGLITDLTDFAHLQEWDDFIADELFKVANYPVEGIYGVPTHKEMIGCFYNKDLFNRLGIPVPTSWDQFFQNLDVLQKNNIAPIALGNLESWHAIHIFGALQSSYSIRFESDARMYGKKGPFWLTDSTRIAGNRIKEWVKSGVLPEKSGSISFDAAGNAFKSGKAGMWITGSWMAADLDRVDFETGFFLLPPGTPEGYKTLGGTNQPFCIPAKSPNQTEAMIFLDFLAREFPAEKVGLLNMLPVMDMDPKTLNLSALGRDMARAWEQIEKDDGLVFYPDWYTPGMYDSLAINLKLLLHNDIEVDAFMQTLQNDFDTFFN